MMSSVRYTLRPRTRTAQRTHRIPDLELDVPSFYFDEFVAVVHADRRHEHRTCAGDRRRNVASMAGSDAGGALKLSSS